MKFFFIALIISFSIVMWTPGNNSNAQEKPDFQSELLSASPNELLELYEVTTHPTKRNSIIEALLLQRENSAPVLRQTLTGGNEKQKLLSLSLLMEMRDKGSGDILIKSLKDHSLKVQRRTAYALGYLKYEEAYESLVSMLEITQDYGVTKSILAGLGMLGKREAISVIQPWLNHSDSSVRVNAAISLAALGSKKGLSEVIKASMSEDNQTRREGTFGLGFFQDHKAQTRLQEIIADPKAPWKSEAQIALIKMDLSTKTPLERLKLLKKLLGHPNKAVSRWAIKEISEVGTPEAIAVLRAIANSITKNGKYAKRKLITLELHK